MVSSSLKREACGRVLSYEHVFVNRSLQLPTYASLLTLSRDCRPNGTAPDRSGIVVSKSPKRPVLHLLVRTILPAGQQNYIKTQPDGVTKMSG